MDRRKQRLLLDLGYKAISDTVYSYGTIIEVISDQELFDESSFIRETQCGYCG